MKLFKFLRSDGHTLVRCVAVAQWGAFGGFVRLWDGGPGIRWTCFRPFFSEREGIVKPFVCIGRWRFFWLERL